MEVDAAFERIANCVRVAGFPVFVLMRGLPGRGKSSFAYRLRDLCLDASISVASVAADDFMVDESTGAYAYNRSLNGFCHCKCTSALVDAMMRRTEVVICHNTNTMAWESVASRANAEELGYLCFICDVQYAWCAAEDLPEQLRTTLVSVHGVADEHTETMRKRAQIIMPSYAALWTSFANLPKPVRDISEELALKAVDPPFSFKISKYNRQIIHSTMEHSGKISNNFDYNASNDSGRINAVNIDAINKSVLERYRVSILGLYLCEVGIGAIVGSGSCKDVRCIMLPDSYTANPTTANPTTANTTTANPTTALQSQRRSVNDMEDDKDDMEDMDSGMGGDEGGVAREELGLGLGLGLELPYYIHSGGGDARYGRLIIWHGSVTHIHYFLI